MKREVKDDDLLVFYNRYGFWKYHNELSRFRQRFQKVTLLQLFSKTNGDSGAPSSGERQNARPTPEIRLIFSAGYTDFNDNKKVCSNWFSPQQWQSALLNTALDKGLYFSD